MTDRAKLEKEVEELKSKVDMKKVDEELRIEHGYSKEEWAKMGELDKLNLLIPNGIWQEEKGEE